MLIQEQFNRSFLLVRQAQMQLFITFLDNQKKQCYNSLKEQQKFSEYYKWLNTVKWM